MSPYAAVENSIQNEKVLDVNDVPLIEKTGELLSNMHIVLVTKALKSLRENVFQRKENLAVKGILISKTWGIISCEMCMPVVGLHTRAAQPHVDVKFSCTTPHPSVDSLCIALRKLLPS